MTPVEGEAVHTGLGGLCRAAQGRILGFELHDFLPQGLDIFLCFDMLLLECLYI